MDIQLTNFPHDTEWVNGVVNDGQYEFEAMLYDEESVNGIDGERVSKLSIRKGDITGWYGIFVNYYRGWDIELETEEQQDVFIHILSFL